MQKHEKQQNQNQVKTAPEGLVPEDFWPNVSVKTDEDVLRLGKANLEALKRHWRTYESHINDEIARLQELLDVLDLGVDELAELAKNYDLPMLPSIGFKNGKGPLPLDSASTHRGATATTFNMCGWCKHAVPKNDDGAKCKLESQCKFMQPQIRAALRQNPFADIQINSFYTECLLINSGQDWVDTLKSAVRAEMEELAAQRRQAARYIKYVNSFLPQAQRRPCFPGSRPKDWFHDGDEAVCLVHDLNFKPATVSAPFVASLVIHATVGWRTSVWTKCQAHASPTGDCRSLNLAITSPVFMHRWEYECLCRDSEYRELWLRAAKREATEEQIRTIEVGLQQELLGP